MDRECAVRVSPGPGQRGVVVTKSMFREPIMWMCGFVGFVEVFLIPILWCSVSMRLQVYIFLFVDEAWFC